MRAFLYRAYLWIRENNVTIDLVLWLILLGMIAYEIVLIRGEIWSATEQMELLRQNSLAASRQADLLNSLIQEQQKSLQHLERMNGILREQLNIIAADQRHRLAELARKPQLQWSIGRVQLSEVQLNEVSFKELTPTTAVFELLMRNAGDAPLRSGLLRIWTDRPGVEITSDASYSPIRGPLGLQGGAIQTLLAILREDATFVFGITLGYSPGSEPFLIHLNAEGENLPRTAKISVMVRPPR